MSLGRSRSGGISDRKHRQPEVEVLAELARRDRGLQVAVRRRDDAHVDVQRHRAADALEPLLLERAQDLRLQRQRQLADLVEEQRAAVRELELARLARRRAGERALLVAEQLRLEQRLGNRRAVDRDERAVGARAQRVQRAREQLLAGAALAFEQHRRVGAPPRDAARRHLLQLRIVADDLRRAAALRELLLQQRCSRWPSAAARARARPSAAGDRDRPAWRGSRARLPSSPRRRPGCCRTRSSRRPAARDRAPSAARRTPKPSPSGSRRSDSTTAGRLAQQRGIGFRLVARFDDGVALRLERMAQHGAQRILVLDEQDGRIGGGRARAAHRSQPGGTPARRASSSRSAMRLLVVCDGLLQPARARRRAFWRSRSIDGALRRVVAVDEVGGQRVDARLRSPRRDSSSLVDLVLQRFQAAGPVRLVFGRSPCVLRVLLCVLPRGFVFAGVLTPRRDTCCGRRDGRGRSRIDRHVRDPCSCRPSPVPEWPSGVPLPSARHRRATALCAVRQAAGRRRSRRRSRSTQRRPPGRDRRRDSKLHLAEVTAGEVVGGA